MLEVNAINLHYGAAQALRGISMKAEPGKVTCVLGRNGVGKTSLLRCADGTAPGVAAARSSGKETTSRRSGLPIARGAASPMCRRGAKSFRC